MLAEVVNSGAFVITLGAFMVADLIMDHLDMFAKIASL
jgi:hypothetical protein